MKFSSEASISVLEFALKREEESRDFYRDCLGKATVSGTRAILTGLVADEERHVAIVTGMLDDARSGADAKAVDIDAPESAKAVLDRALPHAITGDTDFSADSATVGDMLKKALDNEKESFDNYSKAAADAEEAELQDIYRFLAKEESKHFDLISNTIDFLADPGEWLYEEENLIFRL